MSAESAGVGLAAITKFGWIKFASLGAALLGAALMVIFRPPKTRKEMFYQGLVALGSSLLFGDFFVAWAAHFLTFMSVTDAKFNVAIHGLVGALSWGAFGALAHYRDKAATNPEQVVKDVASFK